MNRDDPTGGQAAGDCSRNENTFVTAVGNWSNVPPCLSPDINPSDIIFLLLTNYYINIEATLNLHSVSSNIRTHISREHTSRTVLHSSSCLQITILIVYLQSPS